MCVQAVKNASSILEYMYHATLKFEGVLCAKVLTLGVQCSSP